jgi:hypothetical protein
MALTPGQDIGLEMHATHDQFFRIGKGHGEVVIDGATRKVKGGDASVTGYEVTLGPVTGNLCAAGSEVTVASVGGCALITGEDITLQGAIAGDAALVAENITFGPGAVVAGVLTIYVEEPARMTVPERVAPAARVKIETRKSFDGGEWSDRMPMRVPFWRIVGGFLMGVLVSGLIAVMVIAVASKAVQNGRERAQYPRLAFSAKWPMASTSFLTFPTARRWWTPTSIAFLSTLAVLLKTWALPGQHMAGAARSPWRSSMAGVA